MAEGVDAAVDGLVEHQIIEVIATRFMVGHAKPHGTSDGQYHPSAPVPHPAEVGKATFPNDERDGNHQRNEQPQRPLGKQGHEKPQSHEPLFGSDGMACGVQSPKGTQRQDDEQAHEHVHPDHYRGSGEIGSSEQHEHGGIKIPVRHRTLRPTVHDPDDGRGGQERQHAQCQHGVMTRQHAKKHDKPKIKRRLVGVGLTM